MIVTVSQRGEYVSEIQEIDHVALDKFVTLYFSKESTNLLILCEPWFNHGFLSELKQVVDALWEI